MHKGKTLNRASNLSCSTINGWTSFYHFKKRKYETFSHRHVSMKGDTLLFHWIWLQFDVEDESSSIKIATIISHKLNIALDSSASTNYNKSSVLQRFENPPMDMPRKRILQNAFRQRRVNAKLIKNIRNSAQKFGDYGNEDRAFLFLSDWQRKRQKFNRMSS